MLASGMWCLVDVSVDLAHFIFRAGSLGCMHAKTSVKFKQATWRQQNSLLRVIITVRTSDLNFVDRFSEKISNVKFHKIPPIRSRVVHADGRTDGRRHDVANSRFSQFCERA